MNNNLETTIDIQASKEQVWETLMDFQNYGKWNPFIKKIAWFKDKRLNIIMHSGDKKPMNFKPKVLQNKAAAEFRWKGKLWFKGLFDGEHYFKLEQTHKGTRLTHGEKFSGILTGLILRYIGDDTKNSFLQMNEALKQEVESKIK